MESTILNSTDSASIMNNLISKIRIKKEIYGFASLGKIQIEEMASKSSAL